MITFIIAIASFDGNAWAFLLEPVTVDHDVTRLVLTRREDTLIIDTGEKAFEVPVNGGDVRTVDGAGGEEEPEESRDVDLVEQAYEKLTGDKPGLDTFKLAAAYYRGQVWWVYAGQETTGPLRWRTFRAGRWSREHMFPNTVCGDQPALTVFAGQLYCLHRGVEQEQRMYLSTTDGVSWTTAHSTPMTTSWRPICLVINGALWVGTVTLRRS